MASSGARARNRRTRWWAPGIALMLGCGAIGSGPAPVAQQCSLPNGPIVDGGPGKDGIPALIDPPLVEAGDPAAGYLLDSDRVIGLLVDSQPIAVPLNIGWWHEIVNLDVGERRLAVTHCPLTGSSLVFDRAAVGGPVFGVSGLLYQNNLIMYDRTAGESLWPQMLRGARCGPRSGTVLPMYPSMEATWAGWKALYPGTLVVSSSTGFSRNYRLYPYGRYSDPDDPTLLFPISRVDRRRPPKERVLGILGRDGIAFPFGTLDEQGPLAAIAVTDAVTGVVLWDRAKAAAMAYRPFANGQRLSFTTQAGAIVDRETGSHWLVDGRAISGPLAGAQLEPIADAFVAYWFAWAVFYPEATLWTGP